MTWLTLGLAWLFTPTSGETYEYYGSTLATGDFNGDGQQDLAAGRVGHTNFGTWFSGAVQLNINNNQSTAATLLIESPEDWGSGSFGGRISAGDVTGDGFDDLVVSAPSASVDGINRAGKMVLYVGSAAGLDVDNPQIFDSPVPTTYGNFGQGLAVVGDVDGDGIDDVVVGALQGWSPGQTFLFRGGGGTLTLVGTLDAPAGFGYSYGMVVGAVGDLDGDGLADVAVGGLSESVMVFPGAAALADMNAASVLIEAPEGDGFARHFGDFVGGGGDLDGDGYNDLLIGAPKDDEHGWDSGALYVYNGGPGLIDPLVYEKRTAFDGGPGSYYGNAARIVDDVDGDGAEDLVVGAYGGYYGGAYLYTASATDRLYANNVEAYTADGVGTNFGHAFEEGDIDGDGLNDLYISAPVGRVSGSSVGYPGAIIAFSELYCSQPSAWYADVDNDGLGDAAASIVSCVQPVQYVDNDLDCDDTDPEVLEPHVWTLDNDGDNWGCAGCATVAACEQPVGYAALDWDCDDTDASIHPFAPEIVGDNIDSDCNGEDSAEFSLNCSAAPAPSGLGLVFMALVGLMRRRAGGLGAPN